MALLRRVSGSEKDLQANHCAAVGKLAEQRLPLYRGQCPRGRYALRAARLGAVYPYRARQRVQSVA
jgi:hypothetical protein